MGNVPQLGHRILFKQKHKKVIIKNTIARNNTFKNAYLEVMPQQKR
jgi:hypothetical protein